MERRWPSARSYLLVRLELTPDSPCRPLRRIRRSGLHPLAPGRRAGHTRQRRDALALVAAQREHIADMAAAYSVPAEAIAGALLWDACENPYLRPMLRLGPGRVYPRHVLRPSEAELVEDEGLVSTPAGSALRRARRLRDPEWAIRYIAAIMRRHADNYLRIAGVDVGGDAAVLCTLYQGGMSELRAARLVERRRRDPREKPRAADEMGPWVREHEGVLRALVTSGSPVEEEQQQQLGVRVAVPAPG